MDAAAGERFDVIGIGANSVDYVYRLPGYPEVDGPNAKMRISSHTLCCGGQVATALATCAAMGLRTKYVGATGTDDNGRRIRDELARLGIDTSDAVIRDVTNQFAVIMVDENAGERIVLWDRHDGLVLRPRELAPEILTNARVLHVDGRECVTEHEVRANGRVVGRARFVQRYVEKGSMGTSREAT